MILNRLHINLGMPLCKTSKVLKENFTQKRLLPQKSIRMLKEQLFVAVSARDKL